MHKNSQDIANSYSMKIILSWKKSIFSRTYRIYSEAKLIGKLGDKSFSTSSNGVLNGENYSFKSRGVFKKNITIVNKKENKVIGKISFNNWMSKATLKINDVRYIWKYDNFWNTKWSIRDADGIVIKYAGSTTVGRIHSKTKDPLLLLSGLYVTNYYRQMTAAVFIVIFLPIWMSLLN